MDWMEILLAVIAALLAEFFPTFLEKREVEENDKIVICFLTAILILVMLVWLLLSFQLRYKEFFLTLAFLDGLYIYLTFFPFLEVIESPN